VAALFQTYKEYRHGRACSMSGGELERKNHLEDQFISGLVILLWIFERRYIGLIQLRIEVSGGLL
jgi:hypothetical protein